MLLFLFANSTVHASDLIGSLRLSSLTHPLQLFIVGCALGQGLINRSWAREIVQLQYIFALLNQSLVKIQLESKLDFASVCFPDKLNCLDFCCYFFSELISIIFILFLFRYFVCKDIECNKL